MSENIFKGKDVELDEQTLEKIKEGVSSGNVDYKMLIEMVKEMDSQLKVLEDFANMRIRDEFHLDPSILDNILSLREEDIKEISKENGLDFLRRHYSKDDDYTDLYTTIHRYQKIDKDSEFLTECEAIRKILMEIKNDSMTIYQVKQQIVELKSESADILKEYNTYLASSEVQKKKLERLEKMKEMAGKEEDESKKKEMLKKISVMESSYSLSFLFDRINKYGDKEIESIKDAFFDKRKGSYIIQRYKDKIKQFGFKDKVYRWFFNLEENFLPEEYHVYNNLFLFIYMRTLAYYDPYNKEEKMYGQALTSTIANLVYHRFEETEKEKDFIEIIKKILDKFEVYHDYFGKYNKTQPGHPDRLATELKHETQRRNLLIERMNQMNIDGYPEDGTADELQEYFNNAVEELVKDQVREETDEENVIVTEDEKTGEVFVVPTMKKVEEAVGNTKGFDVMFFGSEDEFEKFKTDTEHKAGDLARVLKKVRKENDGSGENNNEEVIEVNYCFNGTEWTIIEEGEEDTEPDCNVEKDESMIIDIKRKE